MNTASQMGAPICQAFLQMDKEELISNLVTMEAYKQKFQDAQQEVEILKDLLQNRMPVGCIAETTYQPVLDENETLKEQVEAYETLTGVKRGDICAHADPNDDSLYTYKTYEEYEEDAGRASEWEDENGELREEIASLENSNEELETKNEKNQSRNEDLRDFRSVCDSLSLPELTHDCLMDYIKKLKTENDKNQSYIVMTDTSMEEECKGLREEIKAIKASQKQKGRIIKRLNKNVDELKKTVLLWQEQSDDMNLDELYDETNPDHSHKCENEKCLNNAPDTHHECHRCAGYLE